MTIIICHNKPPDRKWDGYRWVGWWHHAQKRWPWDLRIMKRFELRFDSWSKRLGFRIWWYQISLGLDRPKWVKILDMTRCTVRSGGYQHSMVNIGFYDLSLSPRGIKERSQKLINLFVSPVLCIIIGLLCLWHISIWTLLNVKSIFIQMKKFFKTIQLSINTEFNCQKHFYFKLFIFNQAVLIQEIQSSISIVFVYTQLNVKTVLFRTRQFSVNTVSLSKTVLFQTI